MGKTLAALSCAVLASALAAPDASARDVGKAEEDERALDQKAYEASIAALRLDHPDAWVVIAGGKVRATGKTLEDVLPTAPEALHRFVFRVGDDGDGEIPAYFWYGPRFGGLPLAAALDVREIGGSGDEASPFPRTAARVGAPGGRAETMDVLVGTVGPPLLLTPEDGRRLVLQRFEVPGHLRSSWIPFPFRRVLVEVAPEGGGEATRLVAAIPAGTRRQLVELSRGRDFGWFTEVGVWGMDPWAAERRSLAGKWVVVGVDRLLGHGETAEDALLAAEGKAPEAYHRFLTRLPRAAEEVVLDEAAYTETARVVLGGDDVSVRRDPKRADAPLLVDAETADRLRLELAEETRCTSIRRGAVRVPARAGAAWKGPHPSRDPTGKRPELAWLVWPLPPGERAAWCEPTPGVPEGRPAR